jgi:5-(carboxyamino)imidazole ribonucleotide mutase
MKKLLIVVGSKSDLPLLIEPKTLLKKSKIEFEVKIISSHRNIKDLVKQLAPGRLQKAGVVVVLAVAHSVANLPAIIAGYLKNSPIQVVGVGNTKTDVDSIESLLSVVSIPKGIPLLNAGINKIGLYNATLCCIKMIRGPK